MAKCKTNPTAKQRRTMRGSNFALPWSKASALYKRKHKDEDPTRSGKSKAFSGGYPMNCGKKQAVNARQFATKAWKDGNITLADLKLIYKKTQKWGLGPFQDVTCSGRGQKRTCHTKTGAANKGRRSRGRRAGKRWYTHSAGVNQFGTQMWTVTYGDREVADISKSRGEKHFDVVMVSGPNVGRQVEAGTLASAKAEAKRLFLGGRSARGRRADLRGGKTLWSKGKWKIKKIPSHSRYPGESRPGYILVVNEDTGFSDTPTYYDWTEGVAWDHVPPKYVQEATLKVFQRLLQEQGFSNRGRRAGGSSRKPTTIHWRTDDGRTGTSLPHLGEDWKAMRKWLRQTGAKHVYAYTVDSKGDDHLVYEGQPNRGRRAVDTVSARELELYIDNTSQLYPQKTQIRKALLSKVKSGKYNPTLAPKHWMYLVDAGAKRYNKEFGSRGVPWHKVFPKETRMYVAQEYANEFANELDFHGSWEALADEYGVRGEHGLKNRGRRASWW